MDALPDAVVKACRVNLAGFILMRDAGGHVYPGLPSFWSWLKNKST